MPSPGKVISVSGHRFVQLPQHSQPESLHGRLELPLWDLATEQLKWAQPTRLISSGAIGFAMVVTEAARAMGIPYTMAIPFHGFRLRWTDGPRERLESLIQDATDVHYVSRPPYSEHKMTRRNQWMIDNSDWTLALWNGRAGSTANMIMYAWSRRKPVKNIWPEFVRHAATKTL